MILFSNIPLHLNYFGKKSVQHLNNIKSASPMCDMKGMDGWMLKAVGSTLFRPYTFRTCAKRHDQKKFSNGFIII